MMKVPKKRAPKQHYISSKQTVLPGFETPFDKKLSPDNRWVVLAKLIPWDELAGLYYRHVGRSHTGCPPLNPRIVIGSLIIKHLCNLDDREAVCQISENMYMQYFIGYTSFSPDPPFDASLFVEFRKRLGIEQINAINEKIIELKARLDKPKRNNNNEDDKSVSTEQDLDSNQIPSDNEQSNRGKVIFDATVCPQDIAFPTDLNLLADARKKSEELIDTLYNAGSQETKPRTYRQKAHKQYLQTAQKKKKSQKIIFRAVGRQLRYLKRNLRIINELLDTCDQFPLTHSEHRYLLIITTLYEQQEYMHRNRTHQVDDRIVSIHQPHVRPIVRGKAQAMTEFGAKIHVSLIDGITFLDELNWNAFNEGSHLAKYVEMYRSRFGVYPRQVLADKIYCTRENRKYLKSLNIELRAKPLGRPGAVQNHVSPGERNPIEGKFGQAKVAYGMNRIRARLKDTSQSWIACIILVLNLVTLAGAVAYCLNRKVFKQEASVKYITHWVDRFRVIRRQTNLNVCRNMQFSAV